MFDLDIVEPDQQLAHRYRRKGWWTDTSLADLLATSMGGAGNRTMWLHSRAASQQVSMSDVRDLGHRLGAGLAARGLRPGEVVAFQLPNSIEAAAVFYGLAHSGVVLVPLSHAMAPREVLTAVQHCGARAVILDAHGPEAADLAALVGQCTEYVVLVGAPSRSTRVLGFNALVDSAIDRSAVRIDPAAPAVIGWTSGSTAEPKGVILTHRALVAEARLHMAPMLAGSPRPMLSTSPVSHVTGMLISLLVPPLIGRDIHLMDYWDATAALALITRHNLTAGSGAPIFLQTLLDDPSCTPKHHELIGQAFLGGATVSAALVQRAQSCGIVATRSYGCTEHPSISLGRVEDELSVRAGTDGHVNTGVDVRIVDDSGRVCSSGQPGELQTRGPDLFSGYLNPAMNEEAFDRGWFRTGDIGTRDDRGHVVVMDRKKDIIIRAGMNVSAAEVEAILNAMPEVREAAVVAAPDPRTGEHGCAFIRPNSGHAPPGIDAVQRALTAAGLAKYKWPEEIRHQVADFPRTAAGKVRKADLRRMVRGQG
ncbi:hypothetical protein ASE48_16440 [Mycobacterium sp. Root265]|uniref:class I adenylate-forming enzyme family protein n=1 Tax=Mycobacterium sp. Root265 TaxID=1736504 RepID=UPI00070D81A0|nr:AMP-binding protein [Mycobacterium sp. Root265]KRD05754.1 hypothetical protein ASE48_16440 [Mycobacterium sp. Root265]